MKLPAQLSESAQWKFAAIFFHKVDTELFKSIFLKGKWKQKRDNVTMNQK